MWCFPFNSDAAHLVTVLYGICFSFFICQGVFPSVKKSKEKIPQWCRTKSRSKKTYHWRFIHHLKRLCGTFRKQLTKKYGTGIFWNPGKIWHFWCFLAFFGVFGCHFHSAVLFPRVFGTAYDIYPPQTSA